MTDPRLNSIHLEDPRREAFRRAREAMLSGRGENTIYQEGARRLPVLPHQTLVHLEDVAPAPDDADYWLLDRRTTHRLKVGVNTIGRLPDNDVVLEGAYVSRRHCAIVVHTAHNCEVYDIASKNGTFVNGSKLSGPSRLMPGDHIRMCDLDVVFMSRFQTDRRANPDPTHHD